MRTKNKMKDNDAKSEEWWEVAKEYFAKEFKKNMAQPSGTSWRCIIKNLQSLFVEV
jgi:hypothetical protein